jgi:sterol desaturase/sphingolipid hydroxylase (fatty acid hydroxylase superfamily)
LKLGEFLSFVTLIAGAMLALAAFEAVRPFTPRPPTASRRRTLTNLALSALYLGANWGFATWLLALGARTLWVPGLLRSVPAVAQIPLGIVALDLCTYVAHWTLHKVPWLWRAHRVHHADPFVDVTTTLRAHPIEVAWRFAWTAIPAAVLGLPPQAVVVYRLLSALNGLLEHSNLSTPRWVDRALSCFWVTPNLHKIHHADEALLTDTNYGNLLSLFDRLFGTFTSSERASDVTYGLADVSASRATRIYPVLLLPFVGPRPLSRTPGA